MLFFFEFGIFVLAIVAAVLAETIGRPSAVAFWTGIIVVSVIGRVYAGRRFRQAPAHGAEHEKWRRSVLDAWRHFNVLLLLGLLALGLWWAVAG